MELVETIKAGNTLGECALWDEQAPALWWTDIEERQLLRFDWCTRALRRFVMPERLCSFGFLANEAGFIGAFADGFARFDPCNGSFSWLAQPEDLRSGLRLNDGRVDPKGRFWAGAMAEREDCNGGAHLYRFDGALARAESGITISNGIAFSPDGAWFYFADSARRTIWRYAFLADEGRLADRREFAVTPPGAMPDGSAVDAEGCLWNAQWGAGRIVRYAPDGRVVRILSLPVSQPTCVAFGGPGLDLLFVTTARSGLSREALAGQSGAGDVFVYYAGVAGLPENRFGRNGLTGF